MNEDFIANPEMRKIQLKILDIAKEIKRICEKNQIKYFLDGGTLLGAVRHQGFIPWDDDMDIGMVREEYTKFCKVVKTDIGERFLFQSWDIEENYGQPFGKMMLKNTVWIEQATQNVKMAHMLYVDIFVFDGVDKRSLARKKNFWQFHYYHILYLFKCRYDLIFYRRGIKKIGFQMIKFVSVFYDKNKLKKKCKEILASAPKNAEIYFDYGAPAKLERGIRKKEWLDKLIPFQFEDTEFMGTMYYDEWLNKSYGEYMELPPMEQRMSNHGIIMFEV